MAIEDKSLPEIEEAWRNLRALIDGLAESYVAGPGMQPPDAARIQTYMRKLEEE